MKTELIVLTLAALAAFTMLLVAEHTIQKQDAALAQQWLADNWDKY